MPKTQGFTRRDFLVTSGIMLGAAAVPCRADVAAKAGPATDLAPDIAALRRAVVDSPVGVALHRAQLFTKVFQENEGRPWTVRKAMALREYSHTVPLYRRDHDRLAGSISETPGAMPVFVESGIGENNIYTGERPDRKGYLQSRVPAEIRDYWKNRNLWGLYRTEIRGEKPYARADDVPQELGYKFISNQGHLSPSYGELLRIGIGGVLGNVQERQQGETDAEKSTFLTAAEYALSGLSDWIGRYGDFLAAEASRSGDPARAAELTEMARVAGRVAKQPPETFREALQLIWFVHQAIHIEGHGYSCTPDRIDQLLWPFCEADRKAGRIDDAGALRLIENFVLKMYGRRLQRVLRQPDAGHAGGHHRPDRTPVNALDGGVHSSAPSTTPTFTCRPSRVTVTTVSSPGWRRSMADSRSSADLTG